MIEVMTDIERLRGVALRQQGVIARKQALEAGVSSESLRQLTFRGRIERVSRGVYRVPQAPVTAATPLQIAILWTGREEAALGFQTALFAYGLYEEEPSKVHIIVPANARIRRSEGDGYVLHRIDIPEDDLCGWKGMRITKPLRTLQDCLAGGSPATVLERAVTRAAKKGLIAPDDVDVLATQLGL